jgi:hypothetical protein
MTFKEKISLFLTFSGAIAFVVGLTILIGYIPDAKAARSSVTFQAPTDFMASGPWYSMFNQIERLPQGVRIVILWKGVGGYTNLGYQVVSKLQSLQQRHPIRIVVNGNAISMHANALCYLANVERRGILTFHATAYSINNRTKHYAYDKI